MSYEAFLAGKDRRAAQIGVDVDRSALHPALYDWQAESVLWALRTGRCALLWDCGLGKTFAQVEWARLSADTSLIVAPLSVARQTTREARKLDVEVRYVRDGAAIDGPGVWITNYEMVDHFDPALFGAVVLDECFAAGTMVDTPTGAMPIETIRVGDQVLSAAGVSRVRAIKSRHQNRLTVVYTKERRYTCSENHPWLTCRGWVAAKDLRHDDELVTQDEAVRVVRGDLRGTTSRPAQAVLQHVLLSEMENASTRRAGEGPFSGSCCEAGAAPTRMVPIGIAGGPTGNRAHPSAEPDLPARGPRQDQRHTQSDGPWPRSPWWERSRTDGTTASPPRCSRPSVATGVHSGDQAARIRLPDALQARLGVARATARRRMRRLLALLTTGAGREEGRQACDTRVDRTEILQSGDPEFDRLSGGADSVTLYDLDVEGHPSFSIDGLLVHNSSILKNVDGKTRTALIRRFATVPRRLACTATPAPNDVAELTNHAEYLGVMSRAEMLAAYFVNDERDWRLKGHAAEPMYRWMASWAQALRRPSDLGYPDDGWDLPELRIVPQIVTVDVESPGQLFATDLGGVGGRAAVRRQTLDARVARAAELACDDEQWIVWCALNDEADACAKAIDGAVNVPGHWKPDDKAAALEAFQDGDIRVLVSKPAICGFGMNFQNASRMAFVGLGDSYESYYQAVRRCWRYGQTRPVEAHIVVSELEAQIVANVARKERDARRMTDALIRHMIAAQPQGAAA